MPLLIFIYAAIAVFVVGNVYRVLQIALTPAHLRWELYPMPKGTPEQQSYGGSYFEQTEWWKQRRPDSRVSEVLYIAREVLAFATLRKRNRPLWLWSWLMHMGLYLFVVAGALSAGASFTGARLSRVIYWMVVAASCAGITGVVGLIVERASGRMSGLNSRAVWFNLALIGAFFGSALIALFTSAGEALIAFPRALLEMGAVPEIGFWTRVHLVIGGIFLAYFPATHMTHAYMKFFMYHKVRWDDTAAAHNRSIREAMAANVSRPISWAAPHIATETTSTWAEVVAQSSNQEVRR